MTQFYLVEVLLRNAVLSENQRFFQLASGVWFRWKAQVDFRYDITFRETDAVMV